MTVKPIYLISAVIGLVVVVLITALLVPQQTSPAFAVAVDFALAAGKGDDTTATAALSPDLQAYVQENCPEGSVSACVKRFTPPEWGNFLNAVFRRAQPDGADAWDILLLATYAESQGFSGVCIYTRTERVKDNTWHVTRWAGWMSCDAPNAGLSDLIRDSNIPNRAP